MATTTALASRMEARGIPDAPGAWLVLGCSVPIVRRPMAFLCSLATYGEFHSNMDSRTGIGPEGRT